MKKKKRKYNNGSAHKTMPTYDQILDLLVGGPDMNQNPDNEALKTYLGSEDFKYAYGTLYNNYIDQPSEVFAKNNINMAQAKSAAASNPFALTLDILGGALTQYGMSQGGLKDIEGMIGKNNLPALDGIDFENPDMMDQSPLMAALGTTSGTPGGKAEVEGGEAFELPNGKVGVFEGPDHSEGGIDVNLPQGVEIYSKRLKKGGKTHADIAKAYQRRISKLEKRLEASPTDTVVKNTLERENKKWEREKNDLIERQTIATERKQKGLEMKYGTTRKKYVGGTSFLDRLLQPKSEDDPLNEDMSLDTKFGDLVGIAGTIGAGLSPLLNTLKARATDTPNINAFENFGADALGAIADAQGLSETIRTNESIDNDLSRNAAIRRGRNSASSINTARSSDLAVGAAADRTQRQIDNRATSTELSLLQQKAGLENQQDQVVMGGEAARDLADRQDKGAFDTAKGQDLASLFTAVQQVGKMTNESEKQKMLFELQKSLSRYGLMVNNKGEVVNKADTTE